jgi:hypothetical protein
MREEEEQGVDLVRGVGVKKLWRAATDSQVRERCFRAINLLRCVSAVGSSLCLFI